MESLGGLLGAGPLVGPDPKGENRPVADVGQVRFWEWRLSAMGSEEGMSASGENHFSMGCLARPYGRDSLAVTLKTCVSWDQQRTYCENRGLARIDVDAHAMQIFGPHDLKQEKPRGLPSRSVH